MSLRLVTERLVVRDCRAADAAAIADIRADPEVTRHLGGPRDGACERPGGRVLQLHAWQA